MLVYQRVPANKSAKGQPQTTSPQMMVDVEETEDLWHALNVLKRCHDSFFPGTI